MRSRVRCAIAALEEGVRAIHAGVAAQLLEPLADAAAGLIGRRIDQLRRDAGDQMLEIRARLQGTRVGAQAHVEMAEVDQQRHRGEVEQHAENPGKRLGAAMLRDEGIAQRACVRRNPRREQTRQNFVHRRKGPEDQGSMCAERSDIVPERSGRGEDRELVQQCGDLGGLRSVCGTTDEPEHAVGEPADHDRHVFAGLARGCAEGAAQMPEVGQRVPQQRVGRFEVFDQRFLLVELGGDALDEAARRAAGGDGAAELLGDLPQRPEGGDERIVIEEQTVAGPQDIALQGGFIEDQRVDRAQPPFVQRGIRRGATQQQVGQDPQQADDDEHHSARRPDHGGDPARADKVWPRNSPLRVRRNPAISPTSCAVSTLPSWLGAISSIACSRVCARPSWK
jgi:hypothetical protein